MKCIKIGISYSISAIGLMLPWRARVVFSEALGWAAQVIPPKYYQVRRSDETHSE